jgi:hypothetical protein
VFSLVLLFLFSFRFPLRSSPLKDPPSPPEVTGYTPGIPLNTGDNLLCTIRGGNPLVSIVNFYCLDSRSATILFIDQPDTVGAGLVRSEVRVDTSLVTSSTVHCLCVGVWTNQTWYHNHTADVVVTVDCECRLFKCYDRPSYILAIVRNTLLDFFTLILLLHVLPVLV